MDIAALNKRFYLHSEYRQRSNVVLLGMRRGPFFRTSPEECKRGGAGFRAMSVDGPEFRIERPNGAYVSHLLREEGI